MACRKRQALSRIANLGASAKRHKMSPEEIPFGKENQPVSTKNVKTH